MTGVMKYFLIPGRTAVWIFFGLSGYVIFYGFESGRYRMNLADIKAFYINRFLRIYPLFILCSLSVLVIKYIKHLDLPNVDLSFIRSQFFVIQYVHQYDLNGVFWTLGVEMWFYFLAPVFYLIFRRVNDLRIAVGLYFLLFSFGILEALYFGTADVRTLTSNLNHFFVGYMGIKFGPAIYSKFANFTHGQILTLSFFAFLCSAICMGLGIEFFHINLFFTVGSLATDIGIFLVLMLQPRLELTRTSNFLIEKLLLLGVISYGVYVWHAVIVLVLDIDVTKAGHLATHFAMLASVILAKVIYDNYEKKFLSMKKYNHVSII